MSINAKFSPMQHYKLQSNTKNHRPSVSTNLRGDSLLNSPQLNKGTAFTATERATFDLVGKLPPQVETLETQIIRTYAQFQTQATDRQKCVFLYDLYHTNQVLFYKLVSIHIEEMLPLIYTPEIAISIQNYQHEFRRPTGLYITYPERDQLSTIIDRINPDVNLIIITDGERILGIGDQGIGGIQIALGKLMLYSLFGSINPLRSLPIILDIGTNNPTLLADPMYLGWHHPRLAGEVYDAFIADFIQKLTQRFPQILLHWEDFGQNNAYRLLQHYRTKLCTFNDDIQGTAVVAVAAILAAITITKQNLQNQRIVILGAGSAAIGIADLLVQAMVHAGLDTQAARNNLWLIDINGLVTVNNRNLNAAQQQYAKSTDSYAMWQINDQNNRPLLKLASSEEVKEGSERIREELLATSCRSPSGPAFGSCENRRVPADFVSTEPTHKLPEQVEFQKRSNITLLEVTRNLHPTILIGCSTAAGAFTAEIVAEMGKHTTRPIILPLSNPTNLSEATPTDLIKWTDGRALIATGSPFQPINHAGKIYTIAQCNNALVFPGIGLGALACKATRISDAMLWQACRALQKFAPCLQDENQPLLPAIKDAPKVAKAIAYAIAAQAQRDGLTTLDPSYITTTIDDHCWEIEYCEILPI